MIEKIKKANYRLICLSINQIETLNLSSSKSFPAAEVTACAALDQFN